MSARESPPVDDKSDICVKFVLGQLSAHHKKHSKAGNRAPPLFVGLNGIQGVGKSTLVSALATRLSTTYNLHPCVFSIDDLYYPHETLVSLAAQNPLNPLIQFRGEPGTHDLRLGQALIQSLKARDEVIRIPSYDKSAHSGAGDRRPESSWRTVNGRSLDVVIFEGWCLGFRALPEPELYERWKESCTYKHPSSRLWRHRVEDLFWINRQLLNYDILTNSLDAFVYIDTWDLQFVYRWRQEAETKLLKDTGYGMTEDQVVKFINGYYPAYELYCDGLRKTVFNSSEQEDKTGKPRFLSFVVNDKRRVVSVNEF